MTLLSSGLVTQGLAGSEDSPAAKLLGYGVGQLAILSPLVAVLFLVYAGRGTCLARKADQVPYLYLALLSWPTLAFFAYTSWTGTQAEANWPAPAYIAGLLLAWENFSRRHRSSQVQRRWVMGALVISLALSLVARGHLLWQWLPIPPNKDRMPQFLAWPGFGRQIDQLIAAHPRERGYFLGGDMGTRLAEALFYTGNKYVGVDFLLPQRYQFLGDVNRDLAGKSAILMTARPGPLPESLSRHFRQVRPLGDYTFSYKGVEARGTRVYLYLGDDFLGNWEAFDRWRRGEGP